MRLLGPISTMRDMMAFAEEKWAGGSIACPGRNEACRVIGRGSLKVVVCCEDRVRAVGHNIMSHADVLPSSLLP